jgi:hypothetical protein
LIIIDEHPSSGFDLHEVRIVTLDGELDPDIPGVVEPAVG